MISQKQRQRENFECGFQWVTYITNINIVIEYTIEQLLHKLHKYIKCENSLKIIYRKILNNKKIISVHTQKNEAYSNLIFEAICYLNCLFRIKSVLLALREYGS
jgi:hypothetical protein